MLYDSYTMMALYPDTLFPDQGSWHSVSMNDRQWELRKKVKFQKHKGLTGRNAVVYDHGT